MSRRRLARLNEQLKRELSELIRTEVRDPRVGLVTLTGVEVAADLAVAKVFVRVPGGPGEMEETLAGLDAAAPFLRGKLGRLLKIRRVPELRFQEDRSLDHARRIEEILSDVLPQDGEAAEEDEHAEEGEPAERDGAGGNREDAG